jgi:hypothetical protein
MEPKLWINNSFDTTALHFIAPLKGLFGSYCPPELVEGQDDNNISFISMKSGDNQPRRGEMIVAGDLLDKSGMD